MTVWIRSSLPRSVHAIGAWIASNFDIDYNRSGPIAPLHRLKISDRKPDVVSSKLDPVKQQAFIEDYEKLLNDLAPDEKVVFVDAGHPAHQVRVVGCWAPEGETIAISPTSGRDRLNIHGAIDLETGQTQRIEVLTVDALSTIQLTKSILFAYPIMCLIHIYLDNARYHHAKLVKEWLACNGARLKLHFIPADSPHLNPIERLWGAMHKNLTHNKFYGTLSEFQGKVMKFLTHDVPRQWDKLRDSVTDNFRVIDPADFRVVS